MPRTTVLIAPLEAISTLQQQPFLQHSLVFSDGDADVALQRIKVEVPAIIAIERNFATSPSGRAFLAEVREDRTLARCQIQVVAVREAPRVRVDEDVLLDGAAARLLNISVTGAHLVSPSVLKPTQPVTVALPGVATGIPAVAVWVQYELPREGPRYSAGIQFASSAAHSVAEYIAAIGR